PARAPPPEDRCSLHGRQGPPAARQGGQGGAHGGAPGHRQVRPDERERRPVRLVRRRVLIIPSGRPSAMTGGPTTVPTPSVGPSRPRHGPSPSSTPWRYPCSRSSVPDKGRRSPVS